MVTLKIARFHNVHMDHKHCKTDINIIASWQLQRRVLCTVSNNTANMGAVIDLVTRVPFCPHN